MKILIIVLILLLPINGSAESGGKSFSFNTAIDKPEKKRDGYRLSDSDSLISSCKSYGGKGNSHWNCNGYLSSVLDSLDAEIYFPMKGVDGETVVKKLKGELICLTIPITVKLLTELIKAYYKSDDMSEPASKYALVLVFETLAKAFPCHHKNG